MRNPNIV